MNLPIFMSVFEPIDYVSEVGTTLYFLFCRFFTVQQGIQIFSENSYFLLYIRVASALMKKGKILDSRPCLGIASVLYIHWMRYRNRSGLGIIVSRVKHLRIYTSDNVKAWCIFHEFVSLLHRFIRSQVFHTLKNTWWVDP